jgi:hypothetical protein
MESGYSSFFTDSAGSSRGISGRSSRERTETEISVFQNFPHKCILGFFVFFDVAARVEPHPELVVKQYEEASLVLDQTGGRKMLHASSFHGHATAFRMKMV